MRHPLAVGLLALAAAAAGCGGKSPSTDLRIRVHALGGHAWTYELRCNPAGGTVPKPADACRSLAAHRNLLASGELGFEHSCPAGTPWLEVVGKRRGRRVSVFFPECAWVPAQGEGKTQWLGLVHYEFGRKQRYGRLSSDAPLQNAADRARGDTLRRILIRREDALRVRKRALARRRSWVVSHRGLIAAEPLTLQLLRQDAVLAATAGGYLHPTTARLFVTSQGKAESVFAGGDVSSGGPTVYALRIPVGRGELGIVYGAKTLEVTDWSISPRPVRTTALGPGSPLFATDVDAPRVG